MKKKPLYSAGTARLVRVFFAKVIFPETHFSFWRNFFFSGKPYGLLSGYNQGKGLSNSFSKQQTFSFTVKKRFKMCFISSKFQNIVYTY